MSQNENPIENCIICGRETKYRFNDHIDLRHGYVEGAGQLCKRCYNKEDSDEGTLAVPKSWIKKTSNDSELGARVRKLYWDDKEKKDDEKIF